MPQFEVSSTFVPQGDQPNAIKSICESLRNKDPYHVLLGVTGSGKTFTMAKIIEELNRPALIMAPNKTLAAQLFQEFKEFFPNNAVEFFISYYDYYQPEAYVPTSDTYIAKDSSINDDIDKMRHAATMSLLERRDTIIIASVSCIYGLGSPEAYAELAVTIEQGQEIERNDLLKQLIGVQYTRNDTNLQRGCFRVRGDLIDILPSHKRDEAIRIEMFGDEIEQISVVDVLTGKSLQVVDRASIYPNSHYVTQSRKMQTIIKEILTDLGHCLRSFQEQGKLVEFQRLEQRTMQDVESLEHIGFCPGIENYSRYLNGLPPGHPPPTLLDYFPDDFLTIIDESHITVPQIGGMYRGDRARKEVLVQHGFRLPAALDNRPLNFDEFRQRNNQTIFVSATPSNFELEASNGKVTEQIIRPTGLVDPIIEIKPAKGQVDDLYGQVQATLKVEGRVLITTLTKKMAEDLTDYYKTMNVNVAYLHSDIDSLERVNILRDLRKGVYDVLIGINLLREGLDLPEVKLVAVMDADKEGFLRSKTSLIQIVGRAARNAEGRVIFYADKMTDSINGCIQETERRRQKQLDYNEKHGISPKTILKDLPIDLRKLYGLDEPENHQQGEVGDSIVKKLKDAGIKKPKELDKLIKQTEKSMKKAANNLEFEQAANLRDELYALKKLQLELTQNSFED